MNFKTLMFGITWFQAQLVKFVEKSEKANEADEEKIKGIQAKVNERSDEVRKAKIIDKNITKLFEEEEEE